MLQSLQSSLRLVVLCLFLSAFAAAPLGLQAASTGMGQELIAVARLNAGGGPIDNFDADAFFTGGKSYNNPSVTAIEGTDDDAIYLTEHSATSDLEGFSYAIPVPDANTYVVNLHFAEIYWGAPDGGSLGSDGPGGERVFSVNLEGGDVELADFDINAEVGPVTATVESFDVPVTDGTLDIEFTASVNQPKISAIEVLAPAEPAPPTLAIENLDWADYPATAAPALKAHFDRWLAFSGVTDVNAAGNGGGTPDTHRDVTLRLSNESGTDALEISNLRFENNTSNQAGETAFALPNGETSLSIAPGEFYDLDVEFVYAPSGNGDNEIVRAQLLFDSNDPDATTTTIELGGAWQVAVERGNEPNVAEIADAFGFGTTIVEDGQQINNGGAIEAIGEEVLSPFWTRADPSEPVYVRQLAAYHSCCQNTATVFLQPDINSGGTSSFFTHNGVDAQSFLPRINGSSTDPAQGTKTPNGAFGFKIDPEFSDWTRNNKPNPGDEGHHVRFWPVRDLDGNLIPETFLMVMDYSGINYDFNDNVYVVTNITPENVQPLVASTIDDFTIETGDPATDVDLSGVFSDVDPSTSLAYVPTSNFTYSVEGNSNGDAVSTSVSGASLSVAPGASTGSSDLVVRATDPGGRFAETSFTATVTEPFDGCPSYSTLPCADVAVSLPYDLTFDGSEGGLATTGFTMVAPPSARLSEDDPVTFPNLEGYEPRQLNVAGGQLEITTTPGIFYLEPSESSETNSQLNALSVAVDEVAEPIIMETTLSDLPAPTTLSSQQAGLWFGLGESSYVKLVVINTGSGFKVQSLYEFDDFVQPNNGSERNTADGVIPSGSSVTLRLIADPTAGTVTGFYSTDGGQTFTQVEQAAGPHSVDTSLFGGASLQSGLDGLSFAGILATQRRADAPDVYTFEGFNVEQETPTDPFAAQVNFQDEASTPPTGYLADFGQPYAERTGPNQGDGLSYGWVDPETGVPVDLANADNGAGRNRTSTGQSDLRLATLIHMDYPANDDGSRRYPRGSWEIAVPNGTYEVTVAVGEANPGSDPEEHALNVEGAEAVYRFIPPAGNAGNDNRHTTVTVEVGVNDGRLTIDQDGGINTKLNYVDISQILPTRPYAFAVNPANRATDVALDAGFGADIRVPGIDIGVDPSLLSGRVHLYEVAADGSNGVEVPSTTGSSGGNDVITLSPNSPLTANTTYRFVVDGGPDGVQSETGDDFLRFSSIITTGADTGGGDPGSGVFEPVSGVSFEPVDLNVNGTFFTTLQMGPDGKLYGATNTGEIHRYTVEPDGTLSDEEVLTGVAGSGPRLLIGLVFDPASTPNNPIAWVTHTEFGFANVGNRWGGKVSRLSGPDLGTVQDVFVNLPRSAKDHVTNSITLGPDGNLYFLQGSNLAAGAPDNAWGDRPETKLTAAVLTFDPDNPDVLDALSTGTPIDVKTDEPWNGADPSTGTYDPFAPDAPLKVYATGIRNAYDLTWHSNGNLYVPTNGTAAGGESPSFDPADPGVTCSAVRADGLAASALPAVEGVNRDNNDPSQKTHEKQRDFLFRVEEGGYYGHPNPSRCEWVLNIGNPLADTGEPGEGQGGSNYNVGIQPDPNYRGYPEETLGESVYDFGFNKSPNGVIEYRGTNFGQALQGRLLVVRFSNNNDILTLQVDPNTGEFLGEQPGSDIAGFGSAPGQPYNDPLELVENPATGDIYLAQYDRGGGNQKLWLLRPDDRPDDVDAPLLATDAPELIFSGPDNPGITQSKTVTVSNDGTGTLSITSAIIDGANAGEFSVTPATASLDAGQTQDFTVVFDPTDDVNASRALSAELTLQSNAGNSAVGLYALSAEGYDGSNEPLLADAATVLGYDLEVGWNGLAGGTPATERGDETYEPLFQKADTDAPVTITPVARYSPAETLPFGWYTNDAGTTTLNEVGTLADGEPEHQTLFPPLASGTTSFDPGNAEFGFYVDSGVFNHVRYTEDELNSIARGARIYPLDANGATDRRGDPTANRYLVGFEDASNGDYQDYVFVISNVTPADGQQPPTLADLPYRINVGGAAITGTSFGDFTGDDTSYLTGQSVISSKSFDVAGTDDDDLYLNYRYGAEDDQGGASTDFGYAIPVDDGFYTVRLHFVEPFFGAPGGSGGSGEGQRVFSVDLEGAPVIDGLDIAAETGSGEALVETFAGVNVTDGSLDLTFTASTNNAILSAIEVVEEEPVTATCSPISTLECDDVPVSVPFTLDWASDNGGLVDNAGVGTGFSMADPPSQRLAVDDPVSFADAPGYEPSLLSVTDGQLLITSTKGIQYAQPSGTGETSSDTNSQINALGVGFDASQATVLETTIDGLDFSQSASNGFQQTGVWFGLDEDNYVKFNVGKVGGDIGRLELAVEQKPGDGEELIFTSSNDLLDPIPTIEALSSKTVTLRVELSPDAGEATATYIVDGGQPQTLATLPVPPAFFNGADHDSNASTPALSYAGVFTTHRRATADASMTVAFDAFSITPETSEPALTTFDYVASEGWNFIGAALDLQDAAYPALFPTAQVGTFYSYEPGQGYQGGGSSSSIPVGVAHWLEFDDAATATVEGVEVTNVEVQVAAGWNGVSGPSCSLPRTAFGGDAVLASTPIYGYDGTMYQSATALEQGKGYWINVDVGGTLVLDCANATQPLAAARKAELSPSSSATSDFGHIVVQDASGNAQTLLYGSTLQDSDDAAMYMLPPQPPAQSFDVRFANGASLVEASEAMIQMQSAERPFRITLGQAPVQESTSQLRIEQVASGRVVSTQTLAQGETVEVTRPDVTALRIARTEALPNSFALRGNYPNPFRTSTHVAFDLPEAADVELTVYNVLGQRVLSMPRAKMEPGAERAIQVDASNLASGLYLYRLTIDMASDRITETGRMTVVK